jgi:uncharacterized membrane-anchored protein YhcB (DUF1043 family)
MMDWTQVITVFAVIATNLGTIIALYIQTDIKIESHRKESDAKLDQQRKETLDHRKETYDILRAIQMEIKDFHGRLCSIEERNKK